MLIGGWVGPMVGGRFDVVAGGTAGVHMLDGTVPACETATDFSVVISVGSIIACKSALTPETFNQTCANKILHRYNYRLCQKSKHRKE